MRRFSNAGFLAVAQAAALVFWGRAQTALGEQPQQAVGVAVLVALMVVVWRYRRPPRKGLVTTAARMAVAAVLAAMPLMCAVAALLLLRSMQAEAVRAARSASSGPVRRAHSHQLT
jgi:hypothetical protein